jgi:hypothetical protein
VDKYEPLRNAHTNGANSDLDTQAVIEHLQGWDAQYGIELSDAKHDRVVVRFTRVPDDVSALAKDIYAFCPDIIDQNLGCAKEIVEMARDAGKPVPPSLAELIEGVDLEREGYGMELLKRALSKKKTVTLWWD